jgi:tRNA threonylcarbamoyladenosine modification (KEOPS) complex  Pcc1 subunit
MNMAADKSAAILDERLERMNEFRAAMEDQGRRFVSREELELKLAVLVKDVQSLRSAVSMYISWILAVAALVVSVLVALQQ